MLVELLLDDSDPRVTGFLLDDEDFPSNPADEDLPKPEEPLLPPDDLPRPPPLAPRPGVEPSLGLLLIGATMVYVRSFGTNSLNER